MEYDDWCVVGCYFGVGGGLFGNGIGVVSEVWNFGCYLVFVIGGLLCYLLLDVDLVL